MKSKLSRMAFVIISIASAKSGRSSYVSASLLEIDSLSANQLVLCSCPKWLVDGLEILDVVCRNAFLCFRHGVPACTCYKEDAVFGCSAQGMLANQSVSSLAYQ